jgi:hypothetical protein
MRRETDLNTIAYPPWEFKKEMELLKTGGNAVDVLAWARNCEVPESREIIGS